MAALEENSITRLASKMTVDVNVSTATRLFVVPEGKTAIIDHIVVHTASASLTTATISAGWNNPDYDDVFSNTGLSSLTTLSNYKKIQADDGAEMGTADNYLYLIANTLQGSAATITVEVFGYLF